MNQNANNLLDYCNMMKKKSMNTVLLGFSNRLFIHNFLDRINKDRILKFFLKSLLFPFERDHHSITEFFSLGDDLEEIQILVNDE